MKRILLSTSGALGDMLILFPILAGIRKAYPDGRITLLNKHRSVAANSPVALAQRAGYVDEVVVVSKFKMRLWRFLSLIPRPGRRKYDAVFYLQRDGRSLAGKLRKEVPFFSRISRTPVRGAVQLRKLDDPMEKYPRMAELILERINWRSPEPVIPGPACIAFSPQERAAAEKYLRSLGIPGNAVPFVCCVGGKKPVCKWPLDKYEKLLARIIASTPGVPVFVGGPGDEAAIRRLMAVLPEGKAFYAREFSADLWNSICLMSCCAFYLGNDTGSMHMAAAGLKCTGPFGSHAPEGLWEPHGEGHRMIRCRPPMDCTGCRRQNCPKGDPAPCLTAIDAESIFDAVTAFLAEHASSEDTASPAERAAKP